MRGIYFAIKMPRNSGLPAFHFIIEIINFITTMDMSPHYYGSVSREISGIFWEKVTIFFPFLP
jgi:hypothetical protein